MGSLFETPLLQGNLIAKWMKSYFKEIMLIWSKKLPIREDGMQGSCTYNQCNFNTLFNTIKYV